MLLMSDEVLRGSLDYTGRQFSSKKAKNCDVFLYVFLDVCEGGRKMHTF